MAFTTGSEILIKRSNGVVHFATITGIKGTLVQVEWTEAGETKGKEVPLADVVELNRQKENQSSFTQPRAPSSKQGLDRRSHLPQPQLKRLPRVTTRPAISDEQQTTQRFMTQKIVDQPFSSRRFKAPSKDSHVVRKSEAPKQNEIPLQPKMARLTTLNQPQKNTVDTKFIHMIEDYRLQIKAMPPPPPPPTDQRIIVAVRKRPLNAKEKQEIDIVTIPSRDRVILHEPKQKVDLTPVLENTDFRFDHAFDESADNEMVYRYTAKPLVKSIFDGGMATCFAYGQTGSGKTHTMGGSFVSDGKLNQQIDKGIYYYAARDIFALHRSPQYVNEKLIVSASFYEIYGGKTFDLLNKRKKLSVLECKQQVQIVGLSETRVHSVEDVLQLIQQGSACRTSRVTSANSNSSRSHAVVQISLYKQAGRDLNLHGRFSLVDLAGNERAADTGKTNDKKARLEAAAINRSLLALKECIRALGRKLKHCPFRQSRLTHILKDSFIGEKSRTCMIAMISPGKSSCDYTLNTLRYADRVKELVADDPQQGTFEEDMEELSEEDLSTERQNLVKAIQDAEERVHDEHQNLITDTELALKELQSILSMVNDPDYDMYHYSETLNQALQRFHTIHERVGRLPEEIEALRAALVDEERAAGRT